VYRGEASWQERRRGPCSPPTSRHVPFATVVLRRLALLTTVTALGLAACGTATPPQPDSGPGWTLLRAVTPSPITEGVDIAPLGRDAWVVAVTVPGKGGDGCGAPTFVGFEELGTTLVAKISRGPMPNTCAIVDAVTYYVALERVAVPKTIIDVSVSDSSCHSPGCTGPGAAIPS
jgi:hypothetical protein